MSDRGSVLWLEQLPFAAWLVDARGEIVATSPEARVAEGETAGRSIFDVLAGVAALEAMRDCFESDLAHGLLPRAVPAAPGDCGIAPGTRLHLRAWHESGRGRCLIAAEPGALESASRGRLAGLEATLPAIRKVRHEMSNALMGALGQCEMLLAESATTGGARARLEKLSQQLQRLKTLLGDLARASRVPPGV